MSDKGRASNDAGGPPDVLGFPGAGAFRFRVGLRPVAEADWLQPDDERTDQLLEKQRLVQTVPDEVVAHLRGSEAASAEVLGIVVAHLDRAGLIERTGSVVVDRASLITIDLDEVHPIEAAGRLTQEDLCVMEASATGHVLTAASLSFPNRWRLRDKLGLPMAGIHEPVPRYASDVGEATDRVLSTLRPGRILGRLNWSVSDDPTLFQQRDRFVGRVDPDDVGGTTWIRTERQTLRGLANGAVVFGIRTRVRTFTELAQWPTACAELADTLREVPEDVAAYKSFGPTSTSVIAWLDAAAGRSTA